MLASGAIAVPVNPAYTASELAMLIEDAGPVLLVHGSAPLLPSVFAEIEARTGHRILERYGMAEAAMITSNPYAPEGRIPGTVGYPLPGVELRVVGGEGRQELPPGEVGEIEIRGPNLCAGYWQRPEATAEAIGLDGFFVTGVPASRTRRAE